MQNLRSLMSKMAWLVTLVSGAAPAADSYPDNWQTLRQWIHRNVACEAKFEAAVSDPVFLQRLKHMGVMLSDWIPAGPPEGVWFIPKGIQVHGYTVQAVHYWADQGGEFYVEVKTSLPQLQQRFGMRPTSPQVRQTDGYHAIKIMSGGRQRQATMLMFLRPGRGPDLTELGCRRYSLQ